MNKEMKAKSSLINWLVVFGAVVFLTAALFGVMALEH
jgi:hypothetical protein